MAAGAGEDFRLSVSTDNGGTWLPVGGMNRFSANHPKERSEYPIFGTTTPLVRVGNRGGDYSTSGYYDPVDTGQVALRAAALSDATVRIRAQHDGTNGYYVDVKVGPTSHDVDADPTALQETGFEFYQVASPVIVGTGPLP